MSRESHRVEESCECQPCLDTKSLARELAHAHANIATLTAKVAEVERERDEFKGALMVQVHAAEAVNERSTTNALKQIDDIEKTIAASEARVARLEDEIAIDDKLIAERNRILEALPCPAHGPCVPWTLERLKDIAALSQDGMGKEHKDE